MRLAAVVGGLGLGIAALAMLYVAADAQDTELDHRIYAPLVARDNPFGDPPPGSSFSIAFIDVGQADATLVTVGGERLLIDGGRGNLTADRLEALGIDDLDAILATHPDADHIGGFRRILEEYEVERVYLNGGTAQSATFAGFMAAVQMEAGFVRTVSSGERIGLGGLALEVLHPGELSGDSNADSIVLSVTCGAVSVLLTGDATIASEEEMLDAGVLADVDVLKVGHHGSDTSTSQAFLDATAPEYAIISAGRNSQFGHPHPTVVARLEASGAHILATDISEEDDTLVMSSDCETFSFVRTGGAVEATPTPTGAAIEAGIPAGIEITTAFYDPASPDDSSGEYVVLTNTASVPVQMRDWRLDNSDGVVYVFPPFELQPMATVAVHTCGGDNGATDLYTRDCRAIWDNTGDIALLYDADGVVVDQFVYP